MNVHTTHQKVDVQETKSTMELHAGVNAHQEDQKIVQVPNVGMKINAAVSVIQDFIQENAAVDR